MKHSSSRLSIYRPLGFSIIYKKTHDGFLELSSETPHNIYISDCLRRRRKPDMTVDGAGAMAAAAAAAAAAAV